jgi:hypothetical protein
MGEPIGDFMKTVRVQTALATFLIVIALAPSAWGAGSVDAGRAAFSANCQRCHGDPPTAPRFDPYRFNASGLTDAFSRIRRMNVNLDLGAETINDIAAYLGAPDGNDTDRLLDWGEDTFPQLLAPRRQLTQQFSGYIYRFFPTTGVYVGTKDADVWFLDGRMEGAAILNLGTMRSFLEQMPNGR